MLLGNPTLTKSEFKYLHKKIKCTFEDEYLELFGQTFRKNAANSLYGYGDYNPYDEKKAFYQNHSICRSMMQHPQVAKYLNEWNQAAKDENPDSKEKRINGQHLERLKKQSEVMPFIKLTGIYTKIYYLYLGLNEKSFRLEYTNREKKKPVSEALQKAPENSLFYVGHYFSVYDFEIKPFIYLLSKKDGNNESDKRDSFMAQEWGLHNTILDDENEDEEYWGDAYFEMNYLYINQKSKATNRQLNFIGYQEQRIHTQNKRSIICGFLQGISAKHNGPISIECVLCSLSKSEAIKLEQSSHHVEKAHIFDESEFSAIGFYLSLHRYNHKVKNLVVSDFSKLKYKEKAVHQYEYLQGTYRIWNFGLKERHRIVQSKLIILPDGRAFLFPYVEISELEQQIKRTNGNEKRKHKKELKRRMNFMKQACVLHISTHKDIKNKLVIRSFVKLSMVNMAFFDMPQNPVEIEDAESAKKEYDKILKGEFSGIGYNNGYNHLSSYLVMKKEEEAVTFKPRVFNYEQAKIYVKDNGLRDFRKQLYKFVRSKDWPKVKKGEEKKESKIMREINSDYLSR